MATPEKGVRRALPVGPFRVAQVQDVEYSSNSTGSAVAFLSAISKVGSGKFGPAITRDTEGVGFSQTSGSVIGTAGDFH